MTATKDIKTFSTDGDRHGRLLVALGQDHQLRRRARHADRQLETASSTAAANVLSTSVKRFSDPTDFFEALNLFIMFCTALGLATAVAVTEFLEYTVFDTCLLYTSDAADE